MTNKQSEKLWKEIKKIEKEIGLKKISIEYIKDDKDLEMYHEFLKNLQYLNQPPQIGSQYEKE